MSDYHGFPVVDRLHKEITAIGQLPEIHEQFANIGYLPPDPMPQERLMGLIKSEIDRWGKVIENAGFARSQ